MADVQVPGDTTVFLSFLQEKEKRKTDFEGGTWIKFDSIRAMVKTLPCGEFRVVQKKDKSDLKPFSENEKKILEGILANEKNNLENRFKEDSGAQNIVWLVNLDLNSFCMWPHAPVILENYRPTTPDRLYRWSHQILRGLKFLQEQHNIVHRDIHPKNILIKDDFQTALLCDFETATWCDGDGYKCRKYSGPGNRPPGRRQYVPPEYSNPPHWYSFRTDVWGFCATICVSFTGLEPGFNPVVYKTLTHTDNLALFEETALTTVLKEVLTTEKKIPSNSQQSVQEQLDKKLTLSQLREKWPKDSKAFIPKGKKKKEKK